MKNLKRRWIKVYKPYVISASKRIFNWAKRHRDTYPVAVFAIMPVIIFWVQQNIHELNLPIMSRVLVVALLIGLLIYAGCYSVLLREDKLGDARQDSDLKYRASVLAIVTILITFSYGQLYGYYREIVSFLASPKSELIAHRYLLLLLLVLYLGAVYLIRKKMKYSKAGRNYLALVATVLLVFNLIPLANYWVRNYKWNNLSFDTSIPQGQTKNGQKTPDIYYLIFDRYASASVLKQSYNFDNSSFLDSLRKDGFYVADSAANYPFTPFSLASSLNLDYLPDRYIKQAKSSLLTGLYGEIESNVTATFLKNQGYEFINIGPWWDATKYNKNADQDLINPMGVVLLNRKIDMQRHELLLFQDTILWPFFKQPLKSGNSTIMGMTFPADDMPNRALHKQTNLHQFKMLKKVSEQKGSKFIFAHFLLPHEPYVFDENCQKYRSKDEYEIYIKQLQCANTHIKEAVTHILDNSSSDPVIIIQADEGPYPLELRKNENLDWRNVPDEVLYQKTKIINAYHLPGSGNAGLYPNISPVNTFRVVFNKYFGTNLPLLEDRFFISESNKTRRFDMYEITARFKKSPPQDH